MANYDYAGNFAMQSRESNIYANSDLDQGNPNMNQDPRESNIYANSELDRGNPPNTNQQDLKSGLVKKVKGLSKKIKWLLAFVVVTALIALAAVALGVVPYLDQAYLELQRQMNEMRNREKNLNETIQRIESGSHHPSYLATRTICSNSRSNCFHVIYRFA